jgi:hypothetical protein
MLERFFAFQSLLQEPLCSLRGAYRVRLLVAGTDWCYDKRFKLDKIIYTVHSVHYR